MGSTFQPPINLDPNQDHSQQTAFINQNFQSLAAALETNSFRIVKSGNYTVATVNAATTQQFTISHNLGYTPAALLYISEGTEYISLPNFLNATPDTVNKFVKFSDYILYSVDISNITITVINANNVATSSFVVKYFLLQETAS